MAYTNENQIAAPEQQFEQLLQKIAHCPFDARFLELQELIQQSLSDVTPEQIKHLAKLIWIYAKLVVFFDKSQEEGKQFKQRMNRIKKALNFLRLYTIAVIGITGAGKSTLLNAILGRDLLLTGGDGGAATGCAVQIVQDVKKDDKEYAQVEYRNENDIRQLIDDYLVKPYQLSESLLTHKLDQGFVIILRNLKPNIQLFGEANEEFERAREAFVDLVMQYVRNADKTWDTEFDLRNQSEVKELQKLINENSSLNSGLNRQIGLIKIVTLHIQPDSEQQTILRTLGLPSNVCLVDAPGLDGAYLHNIIIRHKIAEADAVIFVVNPGRFKAVNNTSLLKRASQSIAFESDVDSTERIFIVVNPKEANITEDGNLNPEAAENMSIFLEQLLGDRNHPYFITSGLVALQAQREIRGEAIKIPDHVYKGYKTILQVDGKNTIAVLEASGVPTLVQALSNFVANSTEGQIREAEKAIKRIIDNLEHTRKTRQQELTKGTGDFFPRQQMLDLLDRRQHELEEIVTEFRRSQLKYASILQEQLQQSAYAICEKIDVDLAKELPSIWEQNYIQATFEPDGVLFDRIMYEAAIGKVAVALWNQLASRVPELAEEVVRSYEEELESSSLVTDIVGKCFGQVRMEQLSVTIQAAIAVMRSEMVAASKGIGLAEVTDPANGFITFAPNGQPQPSPILDVLKQVPRRQDVKPSDFRDFIAAVRERYQPFVYEGCISALLNMQRYYLIYCERCLMNYLRQIFDQMRCSTDPVLHSKIRGEISNPDWKQLQELEEQLAALAEIKAALVHE
ncbi:MAG TPA: hypothetical protein DDW76_09615 [Cyanobacteria bacterium UBA11369]|nr:hypothetical protein [Cyanobacteria bacterium UBA11371]HBE34976.1 hypothetical protein [Cyanobacteria bacterium UBA11368]HBE49032.1 hypothetical protein [Cyanobacteria bacterium UBA11369]